MGRILGVLCHHTGTDAGGNMPTLDILIHGRPDLNGPLAQLGLGRDGTYYVIAAGRCNHAGVGSWNDVTNGNSNFIGIEAENRGTARDFPWPQVQMDAYHRGVAAILKHVGQHAVSCAGHKEYALPAGRKDDPIFNMDAFRTNVGAILNGGAAAPTLIPRTDPQSGRPTLRRDDTGRFVDELHRKLGMAEGTPFGPRTEAVVREFQRQHGLVPDGIVGPKTWALLGA
jgi:N-acetyl-anhydromuramyl-L-alanine amidase AmpD